LRACHIFVTLGHHHPFSEFFPEFSMWQHCEISLRAVLGAHSPTPTFSNILVVSKMIRNSHQVENKQKDPRIQRHNYVTAVAKGLSKGVNLEQVG